MRLVIFPDAWMFLVSNDHYAGDGRRAERHGIYN